MIAGVNQSRQTCFAMLGKKGSKRKRRLSRPDAEVAAADSKRIRRLLAK